MANNTLQKIKASFQEETEKYAFKTALEIGFGSGEDLIYFSKNYPDRKFYGIDVSNGMYELASGLIAKAACDNVTIKLGDIDDIQNIFPNQKFDMIYTYYGALNTVEDLQKTAECLKRILNDNGKIVITAINKWYMMGILVPFIKGRWKIAFKRLHKVWGGYSPHRHLDSKCYTPGEIKKTFASFKLLSKKGYSILHPAWYQHKIEKKLGKKADWFWKIDSFLNRTPVWSLGEYTLFIFEHR